MTRDSGAFMLHGIKTAFKVEGWPGDKSGEIYRLVCGCGWDFHPLGNYPDGDEVMFHYAHCKKAKIQEEVK